MTDYHNTPPEPTSIARYAVLSVVILIIVLLSRTSVKNESMFIEYRFEVVSCEEIDEMVNKILPAEQARMISVFGVDETLIQCVATNDGGSEWFNQSLQYLQKNKLLSFEEARNVVFPLYKNYLLTNEMELVEASWPWFLTSLQNRGISTIVLSRRSAELGDFTSELLTRLGINLTENYFGEPRTIDLNAEPARYVNGGIYCGLNTKEETFNFFLAERNETKPFGKFLVVLYVDDDSRYIDNVGRGLKSFSQKYRIKVVFYGVHYKAMSAQVSRFELTERHKAELDAAYEKYIEAEELMFIQ